MPYQATLAKGQKQALLAQALAGQAFTPPQRAQGRIVANTGLADSLGMLGQALASRRMDKKAAATTAAGEEERRRAQAQALAGLQPQDQDPNFMGPPQPVNPYSRAQEALAAEIDPAVVSQYLKGQTQGPDGLINNINPDEYEPASVAKFAESRNFGDLVPRANTRENYNPRDYTSDSWAQFKASGDPSVLRRFAPNQARPTSGGGLVSWDPVTNETSTIISDQAGTNAAADKAGAEAAARAQAEAQGKALGVYMQKAASAQGVTDILDIAEPIIDLATGSGTGAVRDKVAAWFGISTEGAQGIAQLAPLQAALMMAQPRMEGPQSELDVQLYREAAGQIGDPKVPAETKKAALKTIRQLQQKYQGYQPGVTPPIPSTTTTQTKGRVPEGVDPELWALMTPQEQSAWQ